MTRKSSMLFVLIAVIAPAQARAQETATPQCHADLARAEALVADIAGRDQTGAGRNPARLCRVLRLNLRQMREAREVMNRCMSGHARRENVSQMDVSMDDVATVIARRCS
ncbi:MAG: hypothetical protein ACRCTD_15935 [Beijerinckiaceae bacterium]